MSSGASCCLGVAQPLSGKRAERGQDLLNGLNLAVANINKEGFKLNGKSLAGSAEAELQKANIPIAIRQSFDDKTTAFDALAQRLQAAQIDAVVSTLNDFQLLALIYALKKISYTQISILGGDSI